MFSQDSLSIPRNVFQMAQEQTHITCLNMSNIDGLTEQALVSIFQIMLIHQPELRKLVFENCKIDQSKIIPFSMLFLSNIKIYHINLNSNNL